jgi:HEAT repeat protein
VSELSEQDIANLLIALEDSDPAVRAKAAGDLIFTKDAKVKDALLTTLKDSDSEVRFWSAFALLIYRHVDVVIDAYFALLKDENPKVRGVAFKGITNNNHISLSRYFQELKSEHVGTRLVVLNYLINTQDKRVQDILVGKIGMRDALYHPNDEIVAAITECLNDENVEVREAAKAGLATKLMRNAEVRKGR